MSQPENTVFEKNIAALLSVDPLLAAKIFEIQENTKYEVYQGNDPLQINLYDNERQISLYEQPHEEVMTKIQEINSKSRYRYLYFYGLGNGVFYKLLLANEGIQRVVIIEPELETLYIVLNLIDFSENIMNHRLRLELSEDFNFGRSMHIMQHPEGQLFSKLFELNIHLPYYQHYYKENIHVVHGFFLQAIEQVILGHGNDVTDSLMGIEHHIQNLPLMLKQPKFQDLLKQKNSDTAIIVSTGPSLHKQLPWLKKIAPYVTVISVDASFPILEREGIKPDLVTIIERVPETAKFFNETSKEFQDDVIFVGVSIIHEEVVKSIRGGTKVLVMRPHGYTSNFQFDEYGYLGVGMSAANMAYELAFMMGVKTCLIIGQDLAFGDDGTSHAPGHLYGDNEETYKETDDYIEKYGGGGMVRTTYYWKLFKNYFEKDILFTKETMLTINCTEGGARIPGTLERPFAQVCQEILDNPVSKSKIQLSFPTQDDVDQYQQRANEKIDEILTYGRKLQKKIEKLFIEVAEVVDELIELNKTNKLERINYSKLAKLNTKIDGIKSVFEEPLFQRLFLDTCRSLLIHQELDLAYIQAADITCEDDKKAKMVDWIMKHKYWLFTFAGAINAQRDIVKRAKRTWKKKSAKA